jgi:hypothetical protein
VSDDKALTTSGGTVPLDVVTSKRVDLGRIYAQMQAMEAASRGGSGGGGGGGYSMAGKTKIEVNKNGSFLFTDPFSGRSVGHKNITIVPVEVKFQLQRWLADSEEIPGINPDNVKGPLCRTASFTDPVEKTVNTEGWFPFPAMSPFHATKMLPDITGTNGPDGQSGETKCSTCRYARQGVKGEEARCKPTGMLECVVFKVGDDWLVDAEGNPQPIYGVIKMSQVNIIAFSEYLDQLKKVHKVNLPQIAICMMEANKVSQGGRTYARVNFHPIGRVTEEIAGMIDKSIEKTEAILAEARSSEDTELVEATPAKKSGNPF